MAKYKVSSGAQAVAVATQWIGTPYGWGGGHGGPVPIGTPVDCSGLVDQVFGITGTTFTQVKMGSGVSSLPNAGAGDLIFFGPIAPGEPHHVGIYIGGGLMIDAPTTGTKVRVDNVSGFGPIYAIRRLVPAGGSADSSTQNSNPQFTYAQLECVWTQAGGSPQYAAMAAAIAMAESGGNSTASNTNSNSTMDRGLWQINSSNGTGSSFDVMTNARAAVAMSGNGTNWRPWCTAYSDGACGSQGGSYQGTGAPYYKFLDVGVQPDCSAPINGTNAAANQGDTPDATEALSILGVNLNPANWIKDAITSLFDPLIQMIAGVMGITAGGALMIGGLYMVVSGSNTVQQSKQTAQKGAANAAMFLGPEGEAVSLGAKGAAGSAATTRWGGTPSRAKTTQGDLRAQSLKFGGIPE